MSEQDIDRIVAIVGEERVNYTSKPPQGITLATGKIALPNVDYKYRVNIKIKDDKYESFLQWANSMGDKVQLPWSCETKLTGNRHAWQSRASYLYVKGSKELLVAQLHIGNIITSVEENIMYTEPQATVQ